MTYKKHLREEDLRTALPSQTGKENNSLHTDGSNLRWDTISFNLLLGLADGTSATLAVSTTSPIPAYTADGELHYVQVTV